MMAGVEGSPGVEYLHAVELADVAVVGLDATGLIRLFNGAAERMTGLARDEVFERPFVDTLLGASADVHRPVLESLLSGVTALEAELSCALRTRSGEDRDLSWRLTRLPTATSAKIVLFAFGHDAVGATSRAVPDPGRDTKLITLIGGLADSMRNPLNGALLHVVVLERSLARRGINGECQEALGVIEAEIQRISKLVTEFLELARPMPVRGRKSPT
jgi:PAS domain S-box-containing protein